MEVSEMLSGGCQDSNRTLLIMLTLRVRSRTRTHGDVPHASVIELCHKGRSPLLIATLRTSPNLTAGHDFLCRVVKRHPLTGLNCRNRHAQCDGMAIARLDVGIRSLATAHALHPIQHVCAGCLVDSSVAAGFDPGSAFHQIARLQ